MTTTNTLYKQNFGFSWTAPSVSKGESLFSFSVLTRTSNGYYSVRLMKPNGTIEKSLTIIGYDVSNFASFKYFTGSKLFVPTNLYLSVFTSNTHHRNAQLYNAVEQDIFIDRSFFNSSFLSDGEFKIELGANYYSKPIQGSNNTLIYDRSLSESVSMIINIENTTMDFQYLEPAYQPEQLTPIYFGISIFVRILILLACFLLLLVRPMKAHGLVPAICVLFAIIRMFSSGIQFATFEFLALNACYFELLLQYPSILCILFIIPLNLLRFMILLIVNERKSNVLQNRESKNASVKFQFKILKFISFPTTIPLLVFGLFIFFMLLFLAMLAIFEFSCPAITVNSEYPAFYVYISLCIFSCAIWFFIMIADMTFLIVLAIQRIKRENMKNYSIPLFFIKFVWKQDVFYFRLQTYVFLLCIIFPTYLTSEVVIDFFYDDILPVSPYLYIIIQTIAEYLYLFNQSVLIIMISLYNLLRIITRKYFGGVSKETDIERKLNDPDFYELLRKFAEQEFSIENVACFQHILEYEKLSNVEERKKLIVKMKYLYFGSDAELEVNVSGSTIKKFMTASSDDNQIDDELFYDIKKTILINLSDTFSRFTSTYEYKNYLQKKQLMKELDVVDM
eukprot:gene11479-4643_t